MDETHGQRLTLRVLNQRRKDNGLPPYSLAEYRTFLHKGGMKKRVEWQRTPIKIPNTKGKKK